MQRIRSRLSHAVDDDPRRTAVLRAEAITLYFELLNGFDTRLKGNLSPSFHVDTVDHEGGRIRTGTGLLNAERADALADVLPFRLFVEPSTDPGTRTARSRKNRPFSGISEICFRPDDIANGTGFRIDNANSSRGYVNAGRRSSNGESDVRSAALIHFEINGGDGGDLKPGASALSSYWPGRKVRNS